MVAKELIRKEIRQYWVQLLLSILAISFMIPIQVWMHYLNTLEFDETYMESQYTINFEYSNPSFIFIILVITLAIVQIGIERSNGSLEFTLAMPFSRASIFLSKWLVGFGSILVSWLISFGLTGLIMKLTEIPSVHFEAYYFLLIGNLLLFYTITFSAGAITGTPFAQGLLTFTISILPLLLVALIGVQLEVFSRTDFQFSENILVQIFNFTPISYLFSYGMNPPEREIYPPFLLAVLFSIIGFYAFIKQPFERNGSFLLWKWMERPIQIVVILLGFLGFSSFGYLTSADNSMMGYFIGAGIGAGIGFIVSYFLINKKKK